MSEKVFKMYFDDQKVIRSICSPVTNVESKEMETLLKDMVTYLKNSQDDKWAEKHHVRGGVGLAAPQIGDGRRFFAVYVIHEGKEYKYGLINPVVLKTSVKLCALKGGEGCLSVKEDKEGYVPRYYRISVKGYDVFEKKEIVVNLSGYPAIIFQHELDHLDGHLYYDHINKLEPWKDDEDVLKI